MTVRELIAALKAMPLDAEVDHAVIDEDCDHDVREVCLRPSGRVVID